MTLRRKVQHSLSVSGRNWIQSLQLAVKVLDCKQNVVMPVINQALVLTSSPLISRKVQLVQETLKAAAAATVHCMQCLLICRTVCALIVLH